MTDPSSGTNSSSSVRDKTNTNSVAKSIKETLTRHHGSLVSEVVVLIHELNRISVLWDERWFDLLNKLDIEMNSRFKKLSMESKRVHSNKSLSLGIPRTLIII